MDKMKRLSDEIRNLMETEFSGYIKINFTQGSLGRIEKSEEIAHDEIIYLTNNSGKRMGGEKKYLLDKA